MYSGGCPGPPKLGYHALRPRTGGPPLSLEFGGSFRLRALPLTRDSARTRPTGSRRFSQGNSMSTIFSKIIAGEIPADIVHQDDRVTAFRDIDPAAPSHILIVPNREIPTVNDLTDEDEALAGHMLLVARDLAKKEGIAQSGYRLIVNCNRDGNQEVFHLHMHLIGGRPLGGMVKRV